MYEKLKRIFFSFRKQQNLPTNIHSDSIFIDSTSVIDNSTFEKWVKVQKQCYLYNSKIGGYTYFAGFNSVMNSSIGRFCSIGSFVSIGPGKHPLEYVSTSPVFFSPFNQCGITFADKSYYREMGTVTIGNDVWIGASSIILDDIIVGDGAVIAANSVVTSNVEPYSIVAGSPAKLIRKRFSEEVIEKLLKFQWWNKDESWLRENFKLFHDPKSFEDLISQP